MKKISFYFSLLLIISLSSCITYVEKDLDIKPKLVLCGYLVPQLDTTIVTLTNSATLFSKKPHKIEVVDNATVEISENNVQWVKMEFSWLYQHYFITQSQFPIREGKTYYIRASAPGFETVLASCTVPFLRETNFNFKIEEAINDIHSGNLYSWLHYHGCLEWTDYPGEENYYMFCHNSLEMMFSWNYDPETDEFIIDTSYHYARGFFHDMNYKPCIYSDKGQDGKKMSATISTNSAFTMNDIKDTIVNIRLLQTDKNCYLLEKSLIDSNDDMQFFLLEPMKIYSNIKNGYGIFGAFVMRDYVFEFEEEDLR
ncbi:MAG: DUF4249 domain-containing protein [Bacteroidetes bacterium]|nr:DUF4249 domain-containing protein [Bacteroidota bacterium]MCL1968300.1 DUF4249 domain-containing protein [Bacteroidota bacterium]